VADLRDGVEDVRRVFGVAGEHDPFVVVTRGLTARDGQAYQLVVATPLSVETRTVATSTGLLAAGSVLLVGLSLAAVSWIVSRALTPVAVISEDVSRISRAGGGDRVTVPESGDEIAALAGTMNAMLDRIARADAASRRFVADASHELRSPLATLRSHVETAEAAPVGVSSSGVDVGLMHAEILRLERLVDEMLTLARADDEGLALRRDEVDLDDLVDAEVRRVRSITDTPVRAHIEPALVTGDAGRLGQVLRNLTENALRHARSEVSVTMQSDGDAVLVHVDNDGPPIPPEQREAVFGRFVRLDDSRARDGGGSGLGLAIARTLAQAHAGTLVTGEAPDGGCRFTLRLPRMETP
jgi:signal transduction histidine kinase